MKQKILNFIFENNVKFFRKKVLDMIRQQDLINVKKKNLETIYNENKQELDLLFTRDFVGNIPKEINEPTLKIFEENSEMFRRWILWQSYYINRKSINDQKNLEKYNGMMIFLKGLFTLADKTKIAQEVRPVNVITPTKSWLDEAIENVNEFKEMIKEKKLSPTE